MSPDSQTTIEYEYIFELKYIPKNTIIKEKIAETQAEAKAQIMKYVKYDPILSAKKNLLAYTLVFVKNEFLVEKIEL